LLSTQGSPSREMSNESALRASLSAWRHLSRDVAPPLAVWAATGAPPPLRPPAAATAAPALLTQLGAADEALLARLRQRQEQLRVVPTELPPSIKLPVALERPLAGLLAYQRKVRAEVMLHADGAALLEDAEASLKLKRSRRARQPREVREVERVERKRVHDSEARRRRTRDGFVIQLLAHGDEFRLFHREARRATGRRAKSVLGDFDSKAKKGKKEADRTQRDRIKALRESNMDDYMQLVKVRGVCVQDELGRVAPRSPHRRPIPSSISCPPLSHLVDRRPHRCFPSYSPFVRAVSVAGLEERANHAAARADGRLPGGVGRKGPGPKGRRPSVGQRRSPVRRGILFRG